MPGISLMIGFICRNEVLHHRSYNLGSIGSFLKNIARQIEFVNDITQSICQDKCLLAMRFDWVRSICLRIIELRVPSLPRNVYNAVLL